MFGSLSVLAASSTGGSSITALLPLVLLVVVFYFILIRPQQRRMRSQRELMSSLSVGDEVATIGGIVGTIRELDDDEVVLEVADGVDLRFLRSAVARKLTYQDEEPYEDEKDHHEHDEEEEAGDQS